jgi:uncharacterized protein YbjT (DUF2867 family)
MKIVVMGGSGLIGSKLVAHLRDLGHDGVPAALDTGVNSITREGLAEVLKGASVLVDVSNSPSYEETAVREFFETSTRNLLDAGAQAGVGHHVVLSIVGTDRLVDSAYYRAKLAQEHLVSSSACPYSIVHSTQFFEFLEPIAQAATEDGVARVAPVFVQPIAADDVVSALAHVSINAPLQGIVEIAGPEQFRFDEVVRHVLLMRGKPDNVVADPNGLYFGGHLEHRTLVPAGHAQLGATRLEDWLARTATAAVR